MSFPQRAVPDEQARAFDRAVCKRLGIDSAIVAEHTFSAGFEVTSGERLGKLIVSLDAYLPADEIVAVFNAATVAPEDGEPRG
ncbi:hypothetical protein ABKW28_12915 [Nocardioides sp. 31GB23]|uniref:hypothetical protein n=1 Tax=Nocardioides sp. 31GB23 TaxID=3156065 RepID=UPI0032AF99B7